MPFSRFHLRLAIIPLLLTAGAANAVAPIANNDARSLPEDTPITIDVLNNDLDADGDSLAVLDIVQAPSNGTVDIVGNSLRYTPRPGFSGMDTFSYTVIDSSEEISNPATVTLTVTSTDFASLARAGNDRSVASALDAACNALIQDGDTNLSPGAQALRTRCISLRELAVTDPGAVARAINRIAPEETIALMLAGSRSSQAHSQTVSQHLNQAGQGISSFSINGLSAQHPAPLGGAAGDLMARFGTFASLRLDTADKDKTARENGFDYTGHALTAGIDYALTDSWIIGSALGWTENKLEFAAGDGEVETRIASLIGFASYSHALGNFDVQLGYNNSEFDVSRTIAYTAPAETVRTTTRGNTYGEHWFISARWQYGWHWQALSVSPYVGLEQLEGRIDAYAENNAAGFEVTLEEQTLKQTTVELGVQASYALNYAWGVMLPQVELRGQSEAEANQDEITGSFAFSPVRSETFLLQSEDGDDLFFNLAIGSSFVLPHGISAFVRYEEMFDYQDLDARRYEIGIRAEF